MLVGAAVPAQAFATCGNGVTFLGMDPWYAELECDGEGNVSQENFRGERIAGTVVKIIVTVVKDLMFLGGLLAVVLVMYGGFLMVTSQGSPSGVEKAKKTISGAIVGLIIAILAYAIATTVLKLTGGSSSGGGNEEEEEHYGLVLSEEELV